MAERARLIQQKVPQLVAAGTTVVREICRSRRRTGRPVGFVGVLLVAFSLLSLAAQVAEAEPTVWGWIVAAVPSLAFLALFKVVLSSAPAAPVVATDEGLARRPIRTGTVAADPEPLREPIVYAPVPTPTRPGSSAVLPPLGVVHPT